MTKNEILNCIKMNGPDGKAIYSALVACVTAELRKTGTAVLPDLVKLTVKKVPARAACTKVIAGKSYDLAAKPETKTVKVKALKGLIDSV